MNTRFRPTPTGDLHLGHAYVATMNYYWAARSGGEFVLIVDDLSAWAQGVPYWAGPPELYAERYADDLAWLGAPPDRVVLSSENVPMHEEVAARCGARKPRLLNGCWFPRTVPPLQEAMWGTRAAGDGLCLPNQRVSFGYCPYYVAARVADDARWAIDAFVRGMDLIFEAAIYDWFCALAGFRTVAQVYTPLVYVQGGNKQQTDSRRTLRELRDAGYDGPAVLDTLHECRSRSTEAGLEGILVPEGILELKGKRRTLGFDNRELACNALAPARADMPFPDETKALNAKRHAEVLKGQRHGLPDDAPEALRRCFAEED